MIKISEIYKKRNKEIYNLFLWKYRQKEIALMYGLSESQVKHIIGAIRKAENEQRAKVPRAHTSQFKRRANVLHSKG